MQAVMLQRVYQRLYSEDYVIPNQHKSQVDTLFYLTRREIRDAVYLMSFFKNQKLNLISGWIIRKMSFTM